MRSRLSVTGVALAVVLAACGGGGGESEAATGTGNGASGTGSGSVGGAVGGAVSTGDAAEAAALALATVNQERDRCGFGRVQRQAQLDTAAGWHADYLKLRFNEGLPATHTEDPARSGFKGATAADRAQAAGYAYARLGEFLSFAPLGGSAPAGEALVRAMMATVYHMAGMLDGNTEVGAAVAFADAAPQAYRQAILAWETGTPLGRQPVEPGVLLTYPCSGSAGLQPYMYGESPEPFSGLGFTAGPGTGHPIYLRAPAGQRIRLSAATLTSGQGRAVPVLLYHASDDAQALLGTHQAFVIPREPLAPGASYQAQVQGTVDGVPFSRDFVFSTGRL